MSALVYTILGLTSIISLILVITGIRTNEEGYVVGGCVMFMIVLFGIGLGSIGPCQSSLDNETITDKPLKLTYEQCVGSKIINGMDNANAMKICLMEAS